MHLYNQDSVAAAKLILAALWAGEGTYGEPDLSRSLIRALHAIRGCVRRILALQQQVCQGRLSAKSGPSLHKHAATVSCTTAYSGL